MFDKVLMPILKEVIKTPLKSVYYRTTFTECMNIFKYNNIRPTSNSEFSFVSTSKKEDCSYCEVLLKLNYTLLERYFDITEHTYFNNGNEYLDLRVITGVSGLNNAQIYIEDIIVNLKHNCKEHHSFQESCTRCKFNEYRINSFEEDISKFTNMKLKFNY
jgi:hypothetical protein